VTTTPRSSLNTKLVRLTSVTLTVAITGIVAAVGFQNYQNAQTQLRETEALIAEGLTQKGASLAENHALALRGMVEANAFGDVDALVGKAVTEDPVVVYGLFLDSDARPWAYKAPGVDGSDREAWKELGVDPNLSEASHREASLFDQDIWEYSAPVELDGEVVGTIRYGLSTSRLEQTLDATRAEAWNELINTLGLVLCVGLAAAFAGVLLSIRRSRAITGPLNTLTEAANRIAGGEREVRANIDSGDELELLAGSFNSMVQDLADSYARLEAFNAGLEQKVAERTAELRVKTDDVTRMLDNIQQGVFTLMGDMTLHEEYSANLETILDRGDLAGADFDELFLQASDLGSAAVDSARVVLGTSFGNPGFMFECNDHLLPQSFSITTAAGASKLVELEYVGIEDENDDLERVLVIVRDVTELRALRQEAERQREALQVVGELLAVPGSDVRTFINGALGFLDRNKELIEAHPEPDEAALDEMFRNMHTLKGNARLLGFSRLNDIVHEAEELYRALRAGDDEAVSWDQQALLANDAGVRAAVQEYADVFEDKLASRGGDDDHESVQATELAGLVAAARSGEITPEDLVYMLEVQVLEATTRSVPEALSGAIGNLQGLAGQLGKEVPEVQFTGDVARVSPELGATLQDVFVHVLRNSMDHGLEDAETRLAAGKPAAGTITIDVSDGSDAITFRVRDDGRGLPLTVLRDKLGKPDASLAEVAEVPFQSGVSTAAQVTSVSGRGVGMDAVRQFLRQGGGDARIEIDPVDVSAERAPFTLVLVCGRPSDASARMAS